MSSLITQYNPHFESIVYTEVRTSESEVPTYLKINAQLAKKLQKTEENEKPSRNNAMRVVAHF